MHKADIHDYDTYYAIRSEPKNIYWTGYSSAPDYHDFRNWFLARLEDHDRLIIIPHLADTPVGAINIDYYDRYVAIGYSIMEIYEGRGLATQLVSEAIQLIKLEKKTRRNLQMIKAWIAADNAASIKVIEKNKFSNSKKEEIRIRRGKEVVFFEFHHPI